MYLCFYYFIFFRTLLFMMKYGHRISPLYFALSQLVTSNISYFSVILLSCDLMERINKKN